jgi:hypothetical protein
MALVYLKLFSGRRSIDEQMRTFGTPGPVLGPFPFMQTAYGDRMKFDRSVVVELVQGLIYYDGTFYGGWSVIDGDTVCRSEDLQQRLETFEPSKAVQPWQGQLAA